MNIPSPKTLSPSGIEKFEQCPLRYSLESLWKIPVEGGFDAAVLGNFVHAVLEHLMKLSPDERNANNTRETAKTVFLEFKESEKYQSLKLEEKEEKKFKSDAWRMLGGYFKIEDPTKIKPVGIEFWVSEEIDGVTVRGIIDRLDALPSGKTDLVDYKTGRPPQPRWAADKFKAMHVYSMLLEDTKGQRPETLRLLYLAGPKEIKIKSTDAQVKETRLRIHNVLGSIEDRIERGEFETNVTRLCDWCPFQAVCPAWGGNMDALMMVAEKSYELFLQEEKEKVARKTA